MALNRFRLASRPPQLAASSGRSTPASGAPRRCQMHRSSFSGTLAPERHCYTTRFHATRTRSSTAVRSPLLRIWIDIYWLPLRHLSDIQKHTFSRLERLQFAVYVEFCIPSAPCTDMPDRQAGRQARGASFVRELCCSRRCCCWMQARFRSDFPAHFCL